MIRRAFLPTIAPLAAACLGLAIPALAGASPSRSAGTSGSSPASGGAGLAGGSAGSSGGGAVARPANQTVSASGNGITVETVESGLLRHRLRFTGSVPSIDAGRVVVIERAASATATSGASWVTTAQATVTSTGSFATRWRASQAGQVTIRAVLLAAGATAARAHRSATGSGTAPVAPSGTDSPALTITVYRPARATFYGPGLWGRRTACGARLRRTTLGLASRTLPCGTQVTVLYRGRALTVPVIDRGPYARGIGWDLTQATAQALGMTGTATVGTVAAR